MWVLELDLDSETLWGVGKLFEVCLATFARTKLVLIIATHEDPMGPLRGGDTRSEDLTPATPSSSVL